MEFIDTNACLLYQLQTEGFVPASRVKSVAVMEIFGQLQQAGIVCKRRKGSGSQFQLEHPEFLQAFIVQTYPEGLFRQEEENRPSRVVGVMQSQDSKTFKQLDFSFLHVRGSAVVQFAGSTYDLTMLTACDASLCLKISSAQHCELTSPMNTVVTVENPTAFVVLEQMLDQPWHLAIYTAGKMSDILIQQLKIWSQQGHQLVHFGDYDYVGLLDFSRILRFNPEADLYCPKAFTQLLQQYGDSQLLEKQVKQHEILLKTMEQLPDSLGKRQLIKIYQLLQQYAKGLEQEGLYKLINIAQ